MIDLPFYALGGILALCFVCAADGAPAETERTLTEDDLSALAWRSIGPANMGGRVAAIAVSPQDAKTMYVGYATGGLWKTTNRGTTFEPIFDDQATSSIGAIGVVAPPPEWTHAGGAKDPGDKDDTRPDVIWVGTGEGNSRNSSSWGHGVYRSVDGGKKFEHRGLAETHEIPAIAVDPRNPDVCYVAALGHLWGENPERGVFKTSDGGRSWDAVLQIDERTGACEVILDPKNPDIVYAALYDRKRTGWSMRSGGPNGGVYRSIDGGRSWAKLIKGLPGQTGRIGIDIHHANPDIVYAVIESNDGGWLGDTWSDRQRAGGVFRSNDRGLTWERTSDYNPRSFYFSKVRVDTEDPDRVYLLGWAMYVSDDGGRNFYGGIAKVPHVDFHALVVDPRDNDHLLLGTDGGFYESHDRGKTWDFHNHMAVGQFYNVAVDDSDPYRVGGGLQDNGSWIGVSETFTESDGEYMGRKGAITNAHWRAIFGGDGFHLEFDPTDKNVVYVEWQGGHIARVHVDTSQWRDLQPVPKEGEQRFRFNWNAPFLVSAHEPTTLYLGGNHVFRLTDRGDRWERISDDLSRQEPDKIATVGSEAETYGTVVALAESSIAEGRLWAGTDDGLVHVTTDDGATWTDVTPDDNPYYVSKIEASHHHGATAYVAIDGHMSDVFAPMIMKTTDLGQTWTNVSGDLPDDMPVIVVREDPWNPAVLYAGTERSAYVTIDGGAHWTKLGGKSLPTVPVDDLVIQQRRRDLVAGTHGRSIWILDGMTALSQLTPDIVQSAFHVFDPVAARPRYSNEAHALWGDRIFAAANPALGAHIDYWIRDYARDDVKITIKDRHGHVVRKLDGSRDVGLNRVTWDLKADKTQQLGNPHDLPEFVPPGPYEITVAFGDDHEATVNVEVLPAPGDGPAPATESSRDEAVPPE